MRVLGTIWMQLFVLNRDGNNLLLYPVLVLNVVIYDVNKYSRTKHREIHNVFYFSRVTLLVVCFLASWHQYSQCISVYCNYSTYKNNYVCKICYWCQNGVISLSSIIFRINIFLRGPFISTTLHYLYLYL